MDLGSQSSTGRMHAPTTPRVSDIQIHHAHSTCCEAVYRELLQVALAELAARDAEIRRLESRLADRVEELRRYVAMKIEKP